MYKKNYNQINNHSPHGKICLYNGKNGRLDEQNLLFSVIQ